MDLYAFGLDNGASLDLSRMATIDLRVPTQEGREVANTSAITSGGGGKEQAPPPPDMEPGQDLSWAAGGLLGRLGASAEGGAAAELLGKGEQLFGEGNLCGAAEKLGEVIHLVEVEAMERAGSPLDVGFGCRAQLLLGLVTAQMGFHEHALELVDTAGAGIPKRDRPAAQALTACYRALVLAVIGQRDQAGEAASQALTAASGLELPLVIAYCRVVLGWSTSDADLLSRGIRRLEGETSAEVGISWFRVMLARLAAERGDRAQAKVHMKEALDSSELDAHFRAGVLSCKGDLLHQEGVDLAGAEAYWREAIVVARAQGARLLELPPTTALTRHLAGALETDQLWELYSWFMEGAETPYLRAAKALLERL